MLAPMRERVFGIETEYAVVYHPSRAERVDDRRPSNLELFQLFEPALMLQLRSLPRAFSLLRAKPGCFLENGCSFHYEATPQAFEHGLVEMASPECRDPFTLLACERAKDALVESLCAHANRQLPLLGFTGEARIGKNNVDVLGHTFGSHESYWVDDPLPPGRRLLLAPLWVGLWLATLPAFAWLLLSMLALAALGVGFALLPLVAAGARAVARALGPRLPRASAFLGRAAARLLAWVGRVTEAARDPGTLVRRLAWLEWPLHPTIALHALVYERFHFVAIRRCATAFLVTRSLFCGAGRVVLDGGPLLRVAQRPPFMRSLARIFTSGERRPVFELRDAFFRPWSAFGRRRRLHLMLGDANLCDWSLVLRTGTTALVLEAIEAEPDAAWPRLARPLPALREVANDPSLERTLQLEDGSAVTALEIQRRTLAVVRRVVGADPAPALWKLRVLAMWEETLDLLEREPAALADRVDWLAKRKLLHQLLPDPADRRALEARGSAVLEATSGASASSPHHAAAADQRLRSLAWRALRIDFAYHELGPRGELRKLEAAGEVRRLTSDDAVARARREPPVDTRAAARGRAIRDAHAQRASGGVSWHRARIGRAWRFFTDPLSPDDTSRLPSERGRS
jgi:proteasome accessory factor A